MAYSERVIVHTKWYDGDNGSVFFFIPASLCIRVKKQNFFEKRFWKRVGGYLVKRANKKQYERTYKFVIYYY